MPPNTPEQDAATELLIAQLIAAEFGSPVLDPLPTFSSSQAGYHSADNNDVSFPAPHGESLQSSGAEQLEEEAWDVNPDSSAIDWAADIWDANNRPAEGDDHGESSENSPDTAPYVASKDLNGSPSGSTSGTTASIGSGEGNSRLQQDEAVWWTSRGNGKTWAVEEAGLDENGDKDQEDDVEDKEGNEDAEYDLEDEDGYEDEEYNGKSKEKNKERKYNNIIIGGVIWIPSPGERRIGRRWAKYTHATFDTEVAEVIVGDDETVEGILAAMVL